MTPIVLILGLLLGACNGIERWDVKTLTDDEKGKVQLSNPMASSVQELLSLPAPAFHDDNPRVDPEKKTFSVVASVVGHKFEEDQDFHGVIADEAGRTMVVEFPDPAYAEGSRVLKQITSARRQFLKHFQEPTKKFAVYKTSPVKVRVVGVGFFDKIHGQKDEVLPRNVTQIV
jgi:hypothetical protein